MDPSSINNVGQVFQMNLFVFALYAIPAIIALIAIAREQRLNTNHRIFLSLVAIFLPLIGPLGVAATLLVTFATKSADQQEVQQIG